MAWLDDRAWAHPKLAMLSDSAFRVWLSGICYSSGFGLRGRLESQHQSVIRATPRIRAELVKAFLWEEVDEGAVLIHDWDDHNDKRDAKRAADRERKRKQRDKERDIQRDRGRDMGVTNQRDRRGLKSEGVKSEETSLSTYRTTANVGGSS